MTTPSTTTAAAPAAPATSPATVAPTTAPVATTAPATGAPASGNAPPAAPARPPVDTKALIAQRKAERERDEALKRLKDAEPMLERLSRIKDPKTRYAAAKELGLDYSEWTAEELAAIGKKPATEEAPAVPPEVAKRLQELEDAENQRKQAATKQQTDAERAKAVKGSVDWLTSNKDKYEICAALEMGERMHDAYNAAVAAQEGVAIDSDEFAAGYEAHFEKSIEAQLTKLAGTAKGKALMQRLLSPGTTEPELTTANPKPTTGLGAGGAKPRALTNGHSSETTAPADRKRLSEKQLRQLAMKQAGMGTPIA